LLFILFIQLSNSAISLLWSLITFFVQIVLSTRSCHAIFQILCHIRLRFTGGEEALKATNSLSALPFILHLVHSIHHLVHYSTQVRYDRHQHDQLQILLSFEGLWLAVVLLNSSISFFWYC